jgi:hypothetical protein
MKQKFQRFDKVKFEVKILFGLQIISINGDYSTGKILSEAKWEVRILFKAVTLELFGHVQAKREWIIQKILNSHRAIGPEMSLKSVYWPLYYLWHCQWWAWGLGSSWNDRKWEEIPGQPYCWAW